MRYTLQRDLAWYVIRCSVSVLFTFVASMPSSFAATNVSAEAAPLYSLTEATRTAPSLRDIGGVWWIATYEPALHPIGGHAVVFTPAGRAAYDKNKAASINGTLVDEARRNCVPDGVPRIMAAPFPMQIVQSANELAIHFEVNGADRTISMNGHAPSSGEPGHNPLGQSVGHWEDDTLVVVTQGFDDKSFLDATGAPHSDQLIVTEYLRKINSGKELEYIAIIDDPVFLNQMFPIRHVYERQANVRLGNYTCGGAHRDITHVKNSTMWK